MLILVVLFRLDKRIANRIDLILSSFNMFTWGRWALPMLKGIDVMTLSWYDLVSHASCDTYV